MKKNMLRIVINAYQKAVRERMEAHEEWQKAIERKESDKTIEIYKLTWRDKCEAYWKCYELLEEYGYTKNQLYIMEVEAME